MPQELLTCIVITKSTTREISVDYTFSDLTVRAAREQPTRFGAASIAVGDILRLQVHAVMLKTVLSDRVPHCLPFRVILLQSS
jgi:hypothetical protein